MDRSSRYRVLNFNITTCLYDFIRYVEIVRLYQHFPLIGGQLLTGTFKFNLLVHEIR